MTLSWQVANRIASIAATQAHDELGIDTTVAPIDVAAAIARAGVELMYLTAVHPFLEEDLRAASSPLVPLPVVGLTKTADGACTGTATPIDLDSTASWVGPLRGRESRSRPAVTLYELIDIETGLLQRLGARLT